MMTKGWIKKQIKAFLIFSQIEWMTYISVM